MTEAVIVSAVRTPIGTSFKGSLTETTPAEMAQLVITEAVARSGLAPGIIDDVILAESNYGAVTSPATRRSKPAWCMLPASRSIGTARAVSLQCRMRAGRSGPAWTVPSSRVEFIRPRSIPGSSIAFPAPPTSGSTTG